MTKRECPDRGGKDKKDRADLQNALDRTAGELQRVGTLLTASWQMVAAILLPTLLGWWLDERLHTKPWLMLAGAIIGIAAGLFGFIRTALAAGKPPGSSQKQGRDPPEQPPG